MPIKKTFRAFVEDKEVGVYHNSAPSGAAKKAVNAHRRKHKVAPKTVKVVDITKSDSVTKGKETVYKVSVEKLSEPMVVKRGSAEFKVTDKVVLKK